MNLGMHHVPNLFQNMKKHLKIEIIHVLEKKYMTKSLISIINISVIKLILLFSFHAILYFPPQFNQFHFVQNLSP